MTTSLEEDIFGPIETVTPEQAAQEWKNLLKLDLAGRKLEYGGHSGQEWKIRATVVALRATSDTVAIEVKDAEATPERDDIKENWESIPLTEICLDRNGDPPKTDHFPVVLPSAMFTEQTQDPGYQSFEIGFIY